MFWRNNGSITVTNVNGVGPFQFSLNGVNFSAPSPLPYTFTGLTAGTYTITVKDANGCTGFVDKTITQPPCWLLHWVAFKILVLARAQVQLLLLYRRFSSYNLSAGQDLAVILHTQKNISGLAAGNYTLTVTDAKGCTKNLNVTCACIACD